jgi:hypothetical protein
MYSSLKLLLTLTPNLAILCPLCLEQPPDKLPLTRISVAQLPENYKTDDDSAKLKTPGATLKQVKDVVNAKAKPAMAAC